MYGQFASCALPVQNLEQCFTIQRIYKTVIREIPVTVPVKRQVRSLVPVTRAIHGTKNVTTNVTVTRQVPEQVCKN